MTTLPVPFAPSAEAALPRQGAGRAQPPAPESAAPQSAAPGLSAAESTEVADVEQLRVTFRRGGRDVHALRGISLRIRAREILGLVWESGSGKSVLGLSLLGLLRAKVQALEALRAREGQIAVLDTNVLMHYQRLDEIPWAEVLGVTPVRIILPICVIDELDNKKYTGSDRMSRRADLAIRMLRRYSPDLRPGSAAALPDGTTLEVFLDDPGHMRMANPDEELRSRCMLLQRATGRPVTLVTGDLGMQLRADAHGLGHAQMPDKYAKDARRRAAAGEE